MNENLDLTKILKDCPKGTKLYSTIFGEVEFIRIDDNSIDYPIDFNTLDGFTLSLTSDGRYNKDYQGECILFPSKDQKDWSKWHKPFKDGDILASKNGFFIGIIKVKNNEVFETYCAINEIGSLTINTPYYFERFATEKEKQRLFQAIKDNGYKWNSETKTLEKWIVPKFKVGDIIRKKDGIEECVITKIHGDLYDYVTSKLYKSPYFIKRERGYFPIDRQDDYELIPDKFNPKFLQPFDKVLCRMNNDDIWGISLFEKYAPTNPYPFFCIQDCFSQCVPYKDNTKHLVGTNNEAPEYYRCWED